MEEDYEASLTSLENENELLHIQGQSEPEQSGEESDDNITSYQNPPTKPSQHKEQKKTGIKRKAADKIPTTTEAKIKKTEESIKKLNDHLKRNTCPKPLRYSARANIPADEEFKKDIKTLKQKAERGFVEALTRFHYRRLEKQKTKLNKENSKTRLDGHTIPASVSKKKIDPTKLRAMAANLQKQYNEVNRILSQLNDSTENKNCEKYSCECVKCVTDSTGGPDTDRVKQSYTKTQRNTAKRRHRRKKSSNNVVSFQTTSGEKYIKNLSNKKITDAQIKLISHGLKFIPVNKLNKNRIRRQLLQDFETFARRMRLKYMFYGHNRNVHPFYVKSNWNPPVQRSVALESYLEEVKLQLTEIQITKPKQNLSRDEQKALNELKQNNDINLKKADKGSTTVIMNKTDKIKEGENLLNDEQSYKRLTKPMVKGSHNKVLHLIADLHRENHIDDMTKKWLSQTPNPPRISEFYTLTKIHKPTITARPIISGCDGPTERISSFVDTLLQPISKSQKSYLKDTTDFINFIEKTKVKKRTFLVSMDVASLYTNIPREEGIDIVCTTYDNFHKNNPPIPTKYLREMLGLILKENSFQFNGRYYLQTHGTAMGTKTAVSFANIFMAKIETEILSKVVSKPTVWKRYIDDVFSLWDISKHDIETFIEQVNLHHPTIKFTAEISNTETVFLDTTVYKGTRFKDQSILDVKTHFKPTETFQYTHFTSCHPPSVKNGFVKGEALRILRTNSSKDTFEENISKFKRHLRDRGYPRNLVEKLLPEIKFTRRGSVLKGNNKTQKHILPFVTQYRPSVSNLKQALLKKWHLIQNQRLLRQIFKEPPIISYRKGKSLRDLLVRAKL